jgi:hypothetical protein
MALREVAPFLFALLAPLAFSGCGATVHAEFDTYAATFKSLAIVADEGRTEEIWTADLLTRLKRVTSVPFLEPAPKPKQETQPQAQAALPPSEGPATPKLFDPVARGRELGVSAVVEVRVTRVVFVSALENILLASLTLGLGTKDSTLEGVVRIYDVASGTKIWELEVGEEDDVVWSQIVTACSEQVLDEWPLRRE